MKIKKYTFPATSVLAGKPYDYYDTFGFCITDKNEQLDSEALARAFFSTTPKWVDALFSLRNRVVKHLGLKVPEEGLRPDADHRSFEVSDQVGFFSVFYKNENEIILGEDDKHLDFRVSLLQDYSANAKSLKNIYCTTTVRYNNSMGRFYFFFVKPFHRLIVPIMLKAMARQLER